jgi:hypothetical protein
MQAPESIRTPAQYLASLPEERRVALKRLHAAIRKAAPKLKPRMVYGMIGYGSYHYRYGSGREGDWPIVALASQKAYISLYVCQPGSDGYLPERNKSRLGKVSVGKSCIRFKRLEDLDFAVAMELVALAAKSSAKTA